MSKEQKSQVDELFGDEELGMEHPRRGDGSPTGSPPKKGRGKLKLVLVALALLAVGLFWYVSSTHHDKYYLRVEGDTVRVERGYFFPVGSGAWGSSNPAYTPFRLPEGVAVPTSGAMSLEEVDVKLYDLYVAIARRNLDDLAAGDVDVAEDMIRRANKLGSSSIARDRKLAQMRGDVAFRRGLMEVRGIQTRLDLALEQFSEATRQGGEKSQGAQQWVDAIYRMRNDVRRLAIDSGLDPDLILTDKAHAARPAGGAQPTVVPPIEPALPPEPHGALPDEPEDE